MNGLVKTLVVLVLGAILGVFGARLLTNGVPPAVPAPRPVEVSTPPAPPAAAAEAPAEPLPAAAHAELARVYQRHKRYDEALQHFEAAAGAEADPARKAQHLWGWGEVLLAQEEPAAAEALFQKAIALTADPQARTNLQFRLSRVYLNADAYDKAEAVLQALLAGGAQDLLAQRAQRELLQVYARQGRLAEHAQALEAQRQANPKDISTLRLLQAIYWGLERQPAKAASVLQALAAQTEAPRQKAQYLYDAAQALGMSRDLEGAVAALRQALPLLEEDALRCRYHQLLAGFLMQTEDYEGAEASYRFVLEKSEQRWEKEGARRQLLMLAKKRGTLAEQVSALQDRLKADPQDREALAALAQATWEVQRNAEAALPVYQALSKLDPKDIALQQRLADIHEARQDFAAAQKVYEGLLEKQPQNRIYYRERLSLLCLRQGDRDGAKAHADRMLADGEGDEHTYARFATLQERLGDFTAAAGAYAEAAKRARRPEMGHEYSLRAAEVWARAGQVGQAETLLKAVLAKGDDKQKGRAKKALVDLYEKQGRLDKVKIDF